MRVRKAAVCAAAILAVAGGLAFTGSRPVLAASVTKCDDSTSPVTGNVAGNMEVPPGAVCHFNGYTVSGDVHVDFGAKLFARSGTSIQGSVYAKKPMQVNIETGSEILKNFSVDGTAPGAYGGFACGVNINGDVILKNLHSGTWVIGEPENAQQENGSYENYDYSGGPSGNDPDLTCKASDNIGGNVWVMNSDDVNRVEISDNAISGSVSIKSNDVVNEFIELENNHISGELACRDNEWDMGTPAISSGGEPNSASVSDGQCAG